jgi:hypothetical protein
MISEELSATISRAASAALLKEQIVVRHLPSAKRDKRGS